MDERLEITKQGTPCPSCGSPNTAVYSDFVHEKCRWGDIFVPREFTRCLFCRYEFVPPWTREETERFLELDEAEQDRVIREELAKRRAPDPFDGDEHGC